MDLLSIAAVVIFIIGYTAITFESELRAHKAPTSMVMGVLLWGMVVAANIQNRTHKLETAGFEILQIFTFLLTAMILVELLDRLGFFDLIRIWLLKQGLKDRQQFIVICLLTFFLSALLDNLTTTIVMITIATRFFTGFNLQVAGAGIVPNANAGGAWSPIGDVTTIMLWLAKKFTAIQIVTMTFFPSLVHGVVVTFLLSRKIGSTDTPDTTEATFRTYNRPTKFLMALVIGTFFLPLPMSRFGLPPFFGLMLGLGVVWLVQGQFRARYADVPNGHSQMSHLQHDIEDLIRKVDIPSLMFFLGILLSVSALGALGILDRTSHYLLGDNPEMIRVALVNIALGWLSAIVDNVPLTSLAIQVIPIEDPRLWTLLAYTVGTGGSHLAIGSVSGVVAMGKIPGLTSTAYFKIATFPVFCGYVAGVTVWTIQTILL